MGSDKCFYFGGKFHLARFSILNRFGDQKVGSQRSQSAPKNEKETKRAETPTQNELTISKKQRRD